MRYYLDLFGGTGEEILEITTMGSEKIRKTWGNRIYAVATEAGPPSDDWLERIKEQRKGD
jgi:hypothetical protein